MAEERELSRPKVGAGTSEQTLAFAEIGSNIGAFELDLSTKEWRWTPQVAVLFGLDPGGATTNFEAWERAVFVDDAPKVRAALEAAAQSGSYYVEFRVKHADGKLHWLAGKGQLAANNGPDGPVLRGTYYDIGERKQLEARLLALNETLEARVHDLRREVAARREAEESLQKLNMYLEQRIAERVRELAISATRLEDTERRFRILVESVTDYAIFMLDPAGTITYWNPGAQRIKGYAPEEIIGQHFSRFYTEEDRKNQLPSETLESAARTGKVATEGWRVRKDGTNFWASVVINAIRDDKGQLIGFAKVTRDLTERRAAEERQRQSQKLEAIGQLTGGVAHDFNNLLTIIIGNLEALQRHLDDRNPDCGRLRRSTDNAMRGARRAESLTQRLLAFSRQQPLEPRSVDVGRLVTGMSDLLRRTLGEHVAVETVLGGGLWRANADPNQLEIAIVNLAVNARDAMPNEGKLTIETANVHLDEHYASAQAEVLPGQYVMLALSDSGVGMTAEVKAKAFDPFFTTKDVGHGTGLGLSQVYGFVKQSRGHVQIYSEVGEGTTVKIYLPRYHPDADDQDEEIRRTVPRGAQHETVLVVEDDDDVRNYTTECLRELGYKVLEASHGQAALQVLEHHSQIQVLFTDIGLPGGMNGRRLAEEALKRCPTVKVLFTTGYARNAIVHDGRLDPGVALLTKPFTRAALAEKLRDIIDAKSPQARVLLVEDDPMIQMLAVDYLEEIGLKVDIAASATDALNKLRLIPGGVDVAVIDMVLPDRDGGTLVREIRSAYPSLPLVVASGRGREELRSLFKDVPLLSVVSKPYTADALTAALRAVGIQCRPAAQVRAD